MLTIKTAKHQTTDFFRVCSLSTNKQQTNSLFIVEVHLALKLVHRHSTFWNKLNRLRIPTGRRQTTWLYTITAEELSQGLPGTNPARGQSGTWTWDLQISSWAPWPRCLPSPHYYFKNLNQQLLLSTRCILKRPVS